MLPLGRRSMTEPGALELNYGIVEFLEEWARLPQFGSRSKAAWVPPGGSRRQGAVAKNAVLPEGVVNVFHVLLPEELPIVAHELMEPLARERQERREEHLQGVDGLESGIDGECGFVAIVLDCYPGCCLIQILIDDGCKPHALLER